MPGIFARAVHQGGHHLTAIPDQMDDMGARHVACDPACVQKVPGCLFQPNWLAGVGHQPVEYAERFDSSPALAPAPPLRPFTKACLPRLLPKRTGGLPLAGQVHTEINPWQYMPSAPQAEEHPGFGKGVYLRMIGQHPLQQGGARAGTADDEKPCCDAVIQPHPRPPDALRFREERSCEETVAHRTRVKLEKLPRTRHFSMESEN